MPHFTFTVYADDEVTPLFEVGTDPAHARPWLRVPSEIGDSEIDLLNGRAHIGQVNLEVIDPQTGATQEVRGLTALLGNVDGHSAVNWRRGVFRQVNPARTIMDGVCYGKQLNDDFVTFAFFIRDIRERARKVPVFTRGGTTTILPRGVVNGYGKIPGGGWLIDPVTPVRGTFRTFGTTQGQIEIDIDRNYSAVILTDQMREAARVTIDPERGPIYPDIEVWWRPVGQTTWRIHANMGTPSYIIAEPSTDVALKLLNRLFDTVSGQYQTPRGTKHSVEYVARLFLQSTDAQAIPANNTEVEALVVYTGPPSEYFPFHFEDTAGVLVRNTMRGDHSFDSGGEPIDPKLRYDETRLVGAGALAVMNTPVRLRITEPVEDMREFIEDVCHSLGTAPALDETGRVWMVDSALPPATATLVEINNTNSEPIPGWEHPGGNAITQIDTEYFRDYLVEIADDPFAERSASDGIASVKQPISVKPKDPTIQQVVGVRTHKIDGFLFRALGGTGGVPINNGDVMDETGAQFVTGRGYEIIDRWAFGGQTRFCRCDRNDPDIAGLKVGDWVIDAVSWRPNYTTGERGGNHLAQVVKIRDTDPAYRELRLIDASPFDNPAAQPTLGAVTVDSRGVLSVVVSAVPAGSETRVEYAVSATVPGTSSSAWKFLGRTAAPTTFRSPPIHSGATVWVRARGEQVGRRPSAYTNPVSATVSQTPKVLGIVVEVDQGVVLVRGAVNEYTAGVRVYYGVHDPSVDAGTLGLYQDFDASLPTWELEGVTVQSGEAITIEVEPWSGWNGTNVTGTAGPDRAMRVLQVSVAAPVTTATWANQGEGRILRLTVEPGGATIRYRLDGVGEWASALGPSVDVSVDLSQGSRVIQFYSTMAGRPTEEVRELQLDTDADPGFDEVSLVEVSANRIKATLVRMDDDCRRFAIWAKLDSLPFLVGDDGQPTGEPDPAFLKDEGDATRDPRVWFAIDGTWHVIARAYNGRGKHIQRTATITIAGAPPVQDSLSNLSIALTGGVHRINWSHSPSVGAGHRVVIRETVGGATRDVLTLPTGRPPTYEAGTTADTTPDAGGYDVPVATGSSFKSFDYEIALYNGSTFVRSYKVSVSGSNYASDGGGSTAPTGSPGNVTIEGNGAGGIRTTWVNSSNLWTIELSYEWLDNGAWLTYFEKQVSASFAEDTEFGLVSGRTVRVWARYVNSYGSGLWSSPSNQAVVP